MLGPYVAKHSMDGARSWTFVVTGEGVGALLGGLAGLRWRPRRHPMVTTGLLLMVTAAQNLILAFHPDDAPAHARRHRLRLRVRPRLGGLGHDAAAEGPAGEARARRVVRLDGRDGLPARPGYALAGPIAMAIGLKTYLVIAAGWIVVSTLFVVRLRAVREVGLDDETDAVPAAAQ